MGGNGNGIEGKGLQHHWKRTENLVVCVHATGQMCLPLWSENLACSFCNNFGLKQTWYGVPSISLPICFLIKQRRVECPLASFSTDYGVVEPVRSRLLMEGARQRLAVGQSKLQHGKAQRGQSQGSRWDQWVFLSEKLYFSFTFQGWFY